mmetsp:Transcript_7003/g.24097  ORF Transcript_7003/g.24097 Transcript_7003/m.24097 type:complete len:342 (-) Transcript_7003:1444-2469(-)
MDKGLLLELVREPGPEVRHGSPGSHLDVHGALHPPAEGHEVRGKADLDRPRLGHLIQLLLHLWNVTVRGYAVRVHPLRDLAVQVALLRAPSRPAHPALGVDDDVLRQDETGVQQRNQRELNAGGVTARIGHQARRGDLLPLELGQAVHGFPLQVGCLVRRAVPLRVHVDVLEPKVRRKVHDLLRLREARDDLLCRPVRKAAKHRIDLIPFYVLYLGQRQVHRRVLGLALEEGLPEVREGGPEGLARAPLARDCPDVNTRVEGQKPCDLGPGVPARAKDSDLGLLGGGRHPHTPREDRLARPKVALPRRSATSAAAQPWPRRERHRTTNKVAPYLIPRPAGG